MRYCCVFLLSLLFSVVSVQAQTKVTKYVFETQEKRQSTRWTLTEWLRIKERMKLMDVWLAMFSSPQKAKFAPELSLQYGLGAGSYELSSADEGEVFSLEKLQQETIRGQFYFTNAISASTGIPTLNIDLGYEYSQNSRSDDFDDLSSNIPEEFSLLSKKTSSHAGLLRIFGDNIQDSNLVIKYGAYTSNQGFLDNAGEAPDQLSGVYAGAEATFYLFKWLGFEGRYDRYGNGRGAAGSSEQSGIRTSYGAFIEIYNLRLGYGLARESWRYMQEEVFYEDSYDNKFGMIKLQF